MIAHDDNEKSLIERLKKQQIWIRLKFVALSTVLFLFSLYGGAMLIVTPLELLRTGHLSSNVSPMEYISSIIILLFCVPLYYRVKKISVALVNHEKKIQEVSSMKKDM